MTMHDFKKPKGLVKIAVCVVSLIAVLMVSINKATCWEKSITYQDINNGRFFLFIFALNLCAEFFFGSLYIGCHEKLGNLPFNWWIFELTFTTCWGFLALLGSILLVVGVDDAKTKANSVNCGNANFNGFEATYAFGFLTMVMMGVNCYFLWREVRDTRPRTEPVTQSVPPGGINGADYYSQDYQRFSNT